MKFSFDVIGNIKKDIDADIKKMERAAMQNAPAWRPEPGDEFRGRLLGVRLCKNEEYGDYPGFG